MKAWKWKVSEMDNKLIEVMAKAVVYTCMVLAAAALLFLFAGVAALALSFMPGGGGFMTVAEIRAARMNIFGLETIDCIMASCHMNRQEVLHSIALYKAEHRDTHPECEQCRMRSGDRPCVFQKGVCRL